jgi:predicted nucleic acid-binding protein
MMVVDASAVIEVLLLTERGARIERRLFGDEASLHAPHLLDVEVLQVLRGLVAARRLEPEVALAKIEALRQMDVLRHAHLDFGPRMFALRHNLTAYDAVYLALAEHLDAVLITGDHVFEGVPGRRTAVEVW